MFDPWVGKIPWRRKQQLTPVFLDKEKSHGQRSLTGSSPWGSKEWDVAERLNNSKFTEQLLCQALCSGHCAQYNFPISVVSFIPKPQSNESSQSLYAARAQSSPHSYPLFSLLLDGSRVSFISNSLDDPVVPAPLWTFIASCVDCTEASDVILQSLISQFLSDFEHSRHIDLPQTLLSQ